MTGQLTGTHVAITGRLSGLTRRSAAELVEERGGVFSESVSTKTDLLVVGQEGWPLTVDGGVSRKLRRARELVAAGRSIEILTEDEFLERLGLAEGRDAARRLFTTAHLSRVLDVPGHRIRSWMRKGLLRPARTAHRLAFFEFRQVAAAKALSELVESGVSPDRLRRSLEEIARCLPGLGAPLEELRILTRGGDLLVRREDGRLSDAHGQLHLDFEPSPPAEAIAPPPPNPASWFEEGLDREDRGDLEGAAEAYERALEVGDREPEVCLNLGNVLFGMGRRDEALARYREAAALDSEYIEAWNNIGNVLSEREEWDEAVTSFQRAISLEPMYADAHLNLAETLVSMGRPGSARSHYRAYLAQDPTSAWADHVHARLEES